MMIEQANGVGGVLEAMREERSCHRPVMLTFSIVHNRNYIVLRPYSMLRKYPSASAHEQVMRCGYPFST